ncbi:MAG TPA: GDSL-type esterase/lipase family protein, partial [Verrucomicrobium sp.]|nr:GDSL-type esterase/lipase family protein [Verrucomicrobium sp.]
MRAFPLHWSGWLAVLVASLNFGGGLTPVGAADAQPAPVTIVTFGDSTTASRGKLTVYSQLLQEELQNVKVINAGVSGNTTEMARRRFETDVLAHQPGVLVIQFGINDAAMDVWKKPPATASRVSEERYEANTKYFIDTAQAKGARVILMAPNPLRWTPQLKTLYGQAPYLPDDPEGFNVLLKKYTDVLRRVSAEKGVPLVDVPTAFAARAQAAGSSVDKLLTDGMHPNDDGQRVVADVLRDQILASATEQKLPITVGPLWKPSGSTVMLNPVVTDITLPSPNPTVLGSGLAPLKGGAVMAVYSTPSSYYSKPGKTWIAGRLTRDGGKTWAEEITIARHSDCQPSHPSVLVSRSGIIHVFYLGFKRWKWQGVNPTPDTESDVWTTRSEDEG